MPLSWISSNWYMNGHYPPLWSNERKWFVSLAIPGPPVCSFVRPIDALMPAPFLYLTVQCKRHSARLQWPRTVTHSVLVVFTSADYWVRTRYPLRSICYAVLTGAHSLKPQWLSQSVLMLIPTARDSRSSGKSASAGSSGLPAYHMGDFYFLTGWNGV